MGRSGGRRAGSVGSINGAVGVVGVGCTIAWVARMHGNPPVSRRFGHKIAPAARCFCFFVRGPGPSEAGRGRLVPERSKRLRPTRRYRCLHSAPRTTLTTQHRLIRARMCAPRPATLLNQHVLAAGGAFFLTKKASLLVEPSRLYSVIQAWRRIAKTGLL